MTLAKKYKLVRLFCPKGMGFSIHNVGPNEEHIFDYLVELSNYCGQNYYVQEYVL